MKLVIYSESYQDARSAKHKNLVVSVPYGSYICSRVEPSAFPYLALLLHEALQYACFFFS